MLNGECLCGQVAFTVSGQYRKLYQCHCSLCRKATGSSANAGLFVAANDFHWLRGADHLYRITL